MSQDERYKNEFSFVFGVLCLIVVVLHSNWAHGFDVFSLGIGNRSLTRLISLFLLSAVPSFFICWGYLSHKYFYSVESPKTFIIRKILQFYPLYLISVILGMVFFPKTIHLLSWKIFFGGLGLYYEPGFLGGNIYIVVCYVLITTAILKFFHIRSTKLMVFCGICLIIAKFLRHDSNFCYIKYFGYYTAFWVGVMLRESSFFELEKEVYAPLYWLILCGVSIGLITPILNIFDVRALEIQYQPNSPEQLFLCVAFLKIEIWFFNKLPSYFKKLSAFKSIIIIGNNAYGHFIFHFFVLNALILVGRALNASKTVTQIIIILATSLITVYLLVIPYRRIESYLNKKFSPQNQ